MKANKSTKTKQSKKIAQQTANMRLFFVLLAILIGVGGAGYIISKYIQYGMHDRKDDIKTIPNYDQLLENSSSTMSENLTNEPARISYKRGEDSVGVYIEALNIRDYGPVFPAGYIKAQWNKGATLLSNEETTLLLNSVENTGYIQNTQISAEAYLQRCLLEEVRLDDSSEKIPCRPYVYEAGSITEPEVYAGQKIYYLNVFVEGLGYGVHTFFLWHNTVENRLILLTEEKYDGAAYIEDGYRQQPWVTGLTEYAFPELTDIPSTIEIPGKISKLQYVKPYSPTNSLTFGNSKEAVNNAGGIIDIQNGTIGQFPSEDTLEFIDPSVGPVYVVDNTYRIVLPDGSQQVYELSPYFFVDETPQDAQKEFYDVGSHVAISWTNAPNNENKKFIIGGDLGTGCAAGVVPCTNIVNNKEWFNENNLVEIGTTEIEETVYELGDKATNSYYKQIYDYGYEASVVIGDNGSWPSAEEFDAFSKRSAEEKYNDFLNDTPIFFWKDYLGNWRVYIRADYRSLAECGKPVIYLYPEQEQDVHVQVFPTGGFTKTDPVYGENGWFVRATPQGELFNYENNTSYPYLFWEGYALDYKKPTTGFVIKREELGKRMAYILTMLGLNTRERDDFLEFWLPKLEQAPYVFVSFLDQKIFDEYAPLTIDPKPNTVIRVFMDYTLLQEPIQVREPMITTPARNGFTVVEWGGRLH